MSTSKDFHFFLTWMEINYVFAGSNESSESDEENEEMARAAQTPGYFEEQQQIKDRLKTQQLN